MLILPKFVIAIRRVGLLATGIVAGLAILLMSSTQAIAVGNAAYITLSEPQPSNIAKIEVLEFFSYKSPSCFQFDSLIAAWVKQQGDTIVFKRIPVVTSSPVSVEMQKLYFVLEAIGLAEAFHGKVFKYIHTQGGQLVSEAEFSEFVAKNGGDSKKFSDAYHSFLIQNKLQTTAQMQTNYKVGDLPYVVIDGRYATSPTIVRQSTGSTQVESEMIKAMDSLVRGDVRGDQRLSVLDAVFYLNKYPDLKAAFGNNVKEAQKHWLANGIMEGRDSSAKFSIQGYLARYPELKNAYGNNYAAALQHWLSTGIKENRNPRPVTAVEVNAAWYGTESRPSFTVGGKSVRDRIGAGMQSGIVVVPANSNAFFGGDPLPNVLKGIAVNVRYNGQVLDLRQWEGKELRFPGRAGIDYCVFNGSTCAIK